MSSRIPVRFISVAFVLVLVLPAACAKFGTTTAPSADDASVSLEGGQVRDGGGPPLANLEPNGTFENGLAPWEHYQGTIAISPVAHGGNQSLELCQAQNHSPFDADDSKPILSAPFGVYHASAWVLADPGRLAPTTTRLRLRTRKDGKDLQFQSSEAVVVSGTWTQLAVSLDVDQANDNLNVQLEVEAAANACVLLDDVVLTKDP